MKEAGRTDWFMFGLAVGLALFGALMVYGGQLWLLAKWDEKKPMLPVPDGIDYLPVVIAGVLIVLFSIRHVQRGPNLFTVNNQETP